MSNVEKHRQAVEKFIELANQLKNDGTELQVVSAGLMTASAVYSTYVYAGNEGFLRDSGVDKVVRAFERELGNVQAIKQKEAEKLSADKAEIEK